MPWTVKDVDEHKKNLSDPAKKLWVSVANSALKRCLADGGKQETCEASAIKAANAMAGNMKESTLAEAATYKAKAKRLMRDMADLLEDRTVPQALRKEIEDVRTALRKTWADLEADSQEEWGHGKNEEAIAQVAVSALEVAAAIANDSGEIDRPTAKRLIEALRSDLKAAQAGDLVEVIKKEGDEIILYSKDGSKVLGRYPFGAGKKFANEETAREAAVKHEREVQFFKHQEASPMRLQEQGKERKKHSEAWHRCWEKVKEKYPDSNAAAICTWSVAREPNPPSVYEAEPMAEKMVTLTIDDADEALAAEMRKRKVKSLRIDTDTWEVEEVKESARMAEDEEWHALQAQAASSPSAGTAVSFADLEATEQAGKAAAALQELTTRFQMLVSNIMYAEAVPDKATAVRTLTDEFTARMAELTKAVKGGGPLPEAAAREPEPLAEATFQESADGFISLVENTDTIALAEAAGAVSATLGTGNRAPVLVDFRIIKPGAGNKRDRHYYPADVLRRDAGVFAGVDIFATDHKEGERSERTKVGCFNSIVAFEDNGAPIGRAVIYDPDMAEKTRNRAAAGKLGTLECSIYATGQARRGQVDGQDYNIVEAITSAAAVELVSKAGAGGRALNLVENADGGDIPVDDTQMNETQQEPEAAPVQEAAPATPAPETQAATIAEAEQDPAPAPEAPPAPVMLAEAEVQAALAEVNLPRVIKTALAHGEYGDKAALDAAIAEAIAEVKKLTGSGQPFGQGAGTAPVTAQQMSEAQYKERQDAIFSKYGLQS